MIQFFQHLCNGLGSRLGRLASPQLMRYAPDGWSTHLPTGDNDGWNSPEVGEIEANKWAEFCSLTEGSAPLGFSHEHDDLTVIDNVSFHNVSITYGYVLARAACGKSTISILDYGGGLGHYYQLGKALLPEVKLIYHCKETPRMVELGKKLNPDIRWFSDDSCLQSSYDLVMVSGSLQYIQNWQKFIGQCSAATNDFLFLTRTPIVEKSASFVAIQQAYGTQMLHWQFNRRELLDVLAAAGLTAVREFLAGDCPHIRNAPEQCTLRGWLLRKTAAASSSERR